MIMLGYISCLRVKGLPRREIDWACGVVGGLLGLRVTSFSATEKGGDLMDSDHREKLYATH